MNRQSGFTVLEMLLALIIAGFASAYLLETTWTGLRTARQGWLETAALHLAQSTAAEVSRAPLLPAGAEETVIEEPPFRVHVLRTAPDSWGAAYRIDVHKTNPDEILATVAARGAGGPPR